MPGQREKAYVLPAVLVIILLLAMVGTALLEISTREAVQVMRETDYIQALNLAEAGIERALWKLSETSGWVDGWVDVPLGEGAYTVSVEDQGNAWYLITSSGTVGAVTKTLTQRVRAIHSLWPSQFLTYALFCANPAGAPSPAGLSNNAAIDGSTFTYGDMTIGSNAAVTGGEVYVTGNCSGPGEYTLGELPDPLPGRLAFDTTYYDNLISQANQQPAGDLTITDTEYHVSGQTLLVKGDVDINNNVLLHGPGQIVATGDIEIFNNCILDPPIDLIAGGTISLRNNIGMPGDGNTVFGRDAVDIQNNSELAIGPLFIFTPGEMSIQNNGFLQGVFWAARTDIRNNVDIHGSVYADVLEGDIRNNATIQYQTPDFDPPPGVPRVLTIIITPEVWSEQEALGI